MSSMPMPSTVELFENPIILLLVWKDCTHCRQSQMVIVGISHYRMAKSIKLIRITLPQKYVTPK